VTRFADVAETGDASDDLAMINPRARSQPCHLRTPGYAEPATTYETSRRPHACSTSVPQGFGVKRSGRLVIAEPGKPPSQQEHVAHQVEYLVELAFGLITMEEFDQARDALTKALELDPSSQRARDRMELVEARLAERDGT
jgi:hypothetical protein